MSFRCWYRRLLFIAAIGAIGGSPAACDDRIVDKTPFLGTWIWGDNAGVVANCAGLPEPLAGSLAKGQLTFRPGTSSDLELEVACYCRVKMQINGLTAVAAGRRQACEQFVLGSSFGNLIDTFGFKISRDDNGDDIATVLSTGSSTIVSKGALVSCATYTEMGTMTRSPTGTVDCGPEDTTVGVLPFSSSDPKYDCPSGPGHDGIALVIDNENLANHDYCTHDSGARGEGLWVLPDAAKYSPPPCGKERIDTYLAFCRVDGGLFKSMIADAGRPEHAYAVLKLGDRCPNGSVEITKRIETNDPLPPNSNANSWGGHPSKSVEIRSKLNSYVKLSFCYFPPASELDNVMNDFPDLGFSYAVFHDFDGPQPAWVVSKRWHYSDDKDSTPNAYLPADPGDFEKIIENTNGDTVFDMARVR